MQGIQIVFGQYGQPVFETQGTVADFDCTVQNALVCLGTNAGTNTIYPDQGTSLLQTATSGALINTAIAQHACNLAANQVLLFSQQNNGDAQDRIVQFKVQVSARQGQQLWADVQAISQNGVISGITTSL